MEHAVCVVGGGPAGAAAALTLARYTQHRVCLCEASHYRTPRIGECVSSAIVPLLAYLDADTILTDQIATPGFGNAAAWGSADLVERDTLFSGRGQGLHLDRRAFDAALSARLPRLGGTLRLGARLSGIVSDEQGWCLTFTDQAAPTRARIVIDASGRHARLARRLGARRLVDDRLVGLALTIECKLASATLVETEEHGWWYLAPLPRGRGILVLMSDADCLRAFDLGSADRLLARAGRTRHVGARLQGARPVEAPIVFPAWTQGTTPVCGPGWIAAGDAAATFDPLTSLGIGHALASGIQAARIADRLLDGDATLARSYPGDIERQRAACRPRLRLLYDQERRWPGSAFWARRRAHAATDGDRAGTGGTL